MSDQDFVFICRLLQERSAVVLDSSKRYLVETRLAPLIRELRLDSIGELVTRLRASPANGLYTQVVEALVTKETFFFRDHHPFEALRKVIIPDLVERRRKERRLDIWCAAAATGQEPYSVAILHKEHFPELAGWKVALLATDISGEVLERARAGRFNQIEVNRGLPAALLKKYFHHHGSSWELRADIRSQVELKELNLALPWPTLPRMDLVLLRNVMIYFDVPTKKTILEKLARVLKPDGYLLLGSAETTLNLHAAYRRVEPLKGGFYQLIG
jgi:chemotaxis protein methyltransferase CheR